MLSIDAHTRVCALLGHPVGHSLSPAIHNAAFEALGLPFVYVAHDVAPADLGAALRGALACGYRGLSVTIPHKVAALSLVDEVDEAGRVVGCINTVVCEGGRLLGSTSDGQGALNALRAAGAHPEGRRVVLLGSGGAARALAVTLALLAPPLSLHLLGIELPELERLSHDVAALGRCPVRAEALEARALVPLLRQTDLLLQCTPIGMAPDADATLVPAEALHPDLAVLDAVYNPRRTRLLTEAARAGCRVVEGMEMFLGQAAVQFELWTGTPAPLEVMRRVLEVSL
jgi:shikimate dehydrogenase